MTQNQGHEDLERVLYDSKTIAGRVEEIAAEISRDYDGGDLVLVSILRGGLIFLADLSRRLSISHTYDLVGAASYGNAAESTGQVVITKDVDVSLRGRDVLLVEDIYDSGRTLRVVRDLLQVHGPKSLEICAFLVKDRPRQNPLTVKYAGFYIENSFVVGYGLDFDEKYRHLNCVGVLKPEIYS